MTDPNTPEGVQPPAQTPPPAPEPAYTQQPPAYAQAPQQPPAYAPAPPAPYGEPVPTKPGRTLGIVAFILSFFIQLVALILGIIALVQSRKAGQKNGFAVAAIIISAVLMVIGIILAVLAISQAVSLGNQIVQNCSDGGSGFVEFWGQRIPCDQIDTSSY